MSNIYLTESGSSEIGFAVAVGPPARGPLKVPVLPGSFIHDPTNPNFPQLIQASIYQYIYAVGLREPSAMLRVVPNATNFTATNINEIIAIGADNDLTELEAGVSVFDGFRGYTLIGAKIDRMVIRARKRQPLAWEMFFRGAGEPTVYGGDATLITSPLLMGWAAYIIPTVGVPGNILGFDLTMNFGAQSNEEIGTAYSEYATEVNASPPLVDLQLEMPTDKTIPTDGQAFGIGVSLDPDDPLALTTFTFENPLNQNPNDVQLGGRRSTRRLGVICRGTAGGAFPVTVADS